MISYFATWQNDQSQLDAFFDRSVVNENTVNKFGALIAHFLVYQFLGIGAFILVTMLLITGIRLFVGASTAKSWIQWSWAMGIGLWLSLFMGFLLPDQPLLGGMVGYEITGFLMTYIGVLGVAGLLVFGLIVFLVIKLKVTPERIYKSFKNQEVNQTESRVAEDLEEEEQQQKVEVPLDLEAEQPTKKESIGSEMSAKETDDIKLTIDKSTDDEPEVKLVL